MTYEKDLLDLCRLNQMEKMDSPTNLQKLIDSKKKQLCYKIIHQGPIITDEAIKTKTG